MKKKIIMIIITVILLLTTSCKKNSIIYENYQCSLSSTMKIYGNRIYYFDGGKCTVYYKRLNDLSIEPTPLCSDTLCSHDTSKCPLFLGMAPYHMAIDENETAANNNYPIIYISSNWAEYKQELGKWDGDGYRIVRYDSAKNTYETVVSKVSNPIGSFCLYKDYIFYTVNDGDAGNNIYAVTKDGKNKYMLDNPDNNSYVIIGAEDDNIFYMDMLGNIYKSDLKLKTNMLLLPQTKSGWGSAYIYNGYLYYADDVNVVAVLGTTDIYNCLIYRIPVIDAENVSPEPVIENVLHFGILPYVFQVNNKIYFCKPNPQYIGLGFYYDIYTKERKDADVFSVGGTIYSYDMDTGETYLEIENEEYDMGIFYGGSDSYIAYRLFEIHKDLDQPFMNLKSSLVIFDTTTKKQFKIEEEIY